MVVTISSVLFTCSVYFFCQIGWIWQSRPLSWSRYEKFRHFSGTSFRLTGLNGFFALLSLNLPERICILFIIIGTFIWALYEILDQISWKHLGFPSVDGFKHAPIKGYNSDDLKSSILITRTYFQLHMFIFYWSLSAFGTVLLFVMFGAVSIIQLVGITTGISTLLLFIRPTNRDALSVSKIEAAYLSKAYVERHTPLYQVDRSNFCPSSNALEQSWS